MLRFGRGDGLEAASVVEGDVWHAWKPCNIMDYLKVDQLDDRLLKHRTRWEYLGTRLNI